MGSQNSLRFAVLLFVLGFFGGCASVRPYQGIGDVERTVSERTQSRVQWNLDKTGGEVQLDSEALLRRKLTVRDAVEVALVKNPDLQAMFEDLGIANADLAAAGLIESPVFRISLGFPVRSPGARTAVDMSLTQNVMDLLQRPLRKKAASAALETAKLSLADSVLRLVAEVKKAYYAYQGALQMQAFRQSILAASQSAAELAQAQRSAGNISVLDVDQHQALYQAARLELERSKAETEIAREDLGRHMGVPSGSAGWRIVEKLPSLPSRDPLLGALSSVAAAQRLDLAASQKRIEASRYAVKLARSAYVPSLAVGVHGDLDPEGTNVVGPTVGIGLPFFGHRKVAVARAEATLRRSEKESNALSVGIASELKNAYERFLLARRTADYYQNNILPLSGRIVGESLKHYNFMLLGNYQLIQAKQNQIAAQRDYIESLKDYWTTRSDLERIVGGTMKDLQ